MDEMTKRILIALCKIEYLRECGKDVDRCDDWELIKEIARSGDISLEHILMNIKDNHGQ